jgi:hypothetical protein
LARLKTLQNLDIHNTKITDAGLMYLFGLKRLKKLYLGYTKVTEAGVKKLRKALPACDIEF